MSFFSQFTYQKLTYSNNAAVATINIDLINEGHSQDQNFIYSRHNGEIKVYDRVCNHNGGRLFLKGQTALCPLHGWELDVDKGRYTNARCNKAPVAVIYEHELDSPLVEISTAVEHLDLLQYTAKKAVDVTFLNHACLHFNLENKITFATDPWVLGSAFCNGWWLVKASPVDVFDVLNSCDFIYISHNHPDHLHPPSLKHIRKDMPMLTAGFDSGSTAEILKAEGFTQVHVMDFSTRMSIDEEEFSISVLKSGDFRDDSGLLIEAGEFKALLTVDSNFLNFGKLPTNVDLLASSFAGGATGFPLCFENHTEEQKDKVVSRNRNAIRATNAQSIEFTKPQFFMPYAGFFTEAAPRDHYILERNIKNSVENYEAICRQQGCGMLNVNEYQIFKFEGSTLVEQLKNDKPDRQDLSVDEYLSQVEVVDDQVLSAAVKTYFEKSAYKDDLVIDLICTDDHFEQNLLQFGVDFSGDAPVLLTQDKLANIEALVLAADKRYLQIKVRRNELYDVIKNAKPWEDLSIGFQCRIYRQPDVYNSEFWFHFTNVYISSKVCL